MNKKVLIVVGIIAVAALILTTQSSFFTQSYHITWSPSWTPSIGHTITATFNWHVSFFGHTPPSDLKNRFYIKDPQGNIKASKELPVTETGSTSLSVKTDYAGYWIAEMHIYSCTYGDDWKEAVWTSKKYVNSKIHVETTPSGARVYITDIGVEGTSPCTLSTPPGNHWVQITKSGYIPWTEKVYIPPTGKTLHVTLEEQEPPEYYDLTVKTNPSGAKIYLSGVEGYKISPCTFEHLIKGWYTVTARKTGYKEASQHVFLDRDKTVTITLTPKTYTLTVKTIPTYADVTIVETGDTKNSGTTGAKFNLNHGTYTVRVEKEGYQTKTTTVTLNKDKTITVDLTEIPPTPPTIEISYTLEVVGATVTALGVALLLLRRL